MKQYPVLFPGKETPSKPNYLKNDSLLLQLGQLFGVQELGPVHAVVVPETLAYAVSRKIL